MRILVVTPEVPATARTPGSQHVYYLVRGLAARGHVVALVSGVRSEALWREFLNADRVAPSLAASYPVPNPGQLSLSGRVLNLLSPRPAFDTRTRAPRYYTQFCEAVASARAEFRPDIVHVDQLAALQYVDAATPGALVLNVNDAVSLAEIRKLELQDRPFPATALWRYQIAKIRNYERRAAARVGAYVVNAEPDRAYLAAFVDPARLRVIPLGVDTTYYSPAPDVTLRERLVFTGTFSYHFNTDAMLYFHANILPRLRARFPAIELAIVGADPPSELRALAARDPLTCVTGYVADTRPPIWESAVFISPLRGGTGVKNKLLIAMALGKAIVATPPSVAGIDVADGQELIVAGDDHAFAGAVERLLRDRARGEALGRAARALVEHVYSDALIAARFEELYRELPERARHIR